MKAPVVRTSQYRVLCFLAIPHRVHCMNNYDQILANLGLASMTDSLARSLSDQLKCQQEIERVDGLAMWDQARAIASSQQLFEQVKKSQQAFGVATVLGVTDRNHDLLAQMYSASRALDRFNDSIPGNPAAVAVQNSFDGIAASVIEQEKQTRSALGLASAFGATSAKDLLLNVGLAGSLTNALQNNNASDIIARKYATTEAAGHAKWLEMLTGSSAAATLQESYHKTLGAFASTAFGDTALEQIRQQYASMFSESEAWKKMLDQLMRPAYLNAFLSDLESGYSSDWVSDASRADYELSEAETQGLIAEMVAVDSPEGFLVFLEKCPQWLKFVIIQLLLAPFVQIALGVAGNLATPHVENLLHITTATAPREQAKEIKKLGVAQVGVELREYRFVTAQKLTVRSEPNVKSNDLVELRFGDMVKTLSATRDWTEVGYESADGTVVIGWVFTRHLAKFRR